MNSQGTNLLTAKPVYKPFAYPWAYEAWKEQQKLHWLPDEVPLGEDVKDWKINLSDGERNLLSQIFRFFTQADIEVNECYLTKYSQVFKPTEIRMMMSAIANIETVHIDAYSHLMDTLGFDEEEYSAFREYKEMEDKYNYYSKFDVEDKIGVAETMAVYGAFTEGLQLFASFAILLNFPRFGKMKGMGQIIQWSVRDESLHCECIVRLYHEWLKENPDIDTDSLTVRITEHLHNIIMMEDRFIDLAFELGPVEGLTADEVKLYIRYLADRRMEQLRLAKQFFIDKNPIPWIDAYMSGPRHTNFFEQKSTEYSKASTTGSWEDVSF